ncbi:MAG: MBL fold metallo-hydrolase [Hyphomicrobiales bacterium]|nr:MBL fold metallo-hydrolase [Hyphomicrobiales bacterium]
MAQGIQLGEISIQQIVEQQGPFFPVGEFFPSLAPELLEENREWLEPAFVDPDSGNVILCIQSYVVRTRHHTILIDSCVGNHKPRPNRPMWHLMASDRYERNFEATGLRFEDIDYVMCTHLHTDHVGWNTRLDNGRWVPTFPNARYVFAERELDFWSDRTSQDPDACPWMVDSVLPVVEAGRAEIVKSDHMLGDDVQLIPSPGHTIDHYSVLVGRPQADALITGDMVHSPLQARYPELGMFSDYDSVLAGQTRRELFGRFCDSSTLMCTAHFPTPSTGHVRRWSEGFRIV